MEEEGEEVNVGSTVTDPYKGGVVSTGCSECFEMTELGDDSGAEEIW